MTSRFRIAMAMGLAVTSVTGISWASEPIITDTRIITDDLRMSVLEAKLLSLRKQVDLLEDVKAIERLQQSYGYYVSEGMGSEVAALFADSPVSSMEIGGRGVYLGKDRIGKFLTRDGEGIKHGEIREAPIFQGIVHVAPDGKTAKGRWRALIMSGTQGQDGNWVEGPYENEYVKERGVWKFSKVHWYAGVIASYDEGWHKKPLPLPGPVTDVPPDLPPSEQYQPFPAFFMPPYHYLHPVTNKPVVAE